MAIKIDIVIFILKDKMYLNNKKVHFFMTEPQHYLDGEEVPSSSTSPITNVGRLPETPEDPSSP